jgi:hypothetical protein
VLLLILHGAATWFMTGVIWLVQVVHYPLLRRVGLAETGSYIESHLRRVSLVVIPGMVLEAITAVLLLFTGLAGLPSALPGVGLALVVLIWLSTAMLQMPAHHRLLAGHNPAALERLIRTNWIRTVLWSIRAVLAAVMLATAASR